MIFSAFLEGAPVTREQVVGWSGHNSPSLRPALVATLLDTLIPKVLAIEGKTEAGEVS